MKSVSYLRLVRYLIAAQQNRHQLTPPTEQPRTQAPLAPPTAVKRRLAFKRFSRFSGPCGPSMTLRGYPPKP